MKILLSAYACEPDRGSEPDVGWNWAIGLPKLGHDLWVLTRANNKPVIEQYFAHNQQHQNLHFIYYDLPPWVRCFKKGTRGVHIYYLLWQWGAYKTAKEVHAREHFALVHHVTFVSARQPSFMGNLGIPFIFGPVAGGEHAPWRLRFHYGIRGFVIDAVRDITNLLVRFDPLMWRTFKQAQDIYVTSEQSKKLIPPCFHKKTKVQLAIGINLSEFDHPETSRRHTGFRVLYVGNFLYLKGMGLGIKAFAQLIRQVPEARLTMVGRGADEKSWRLLAEKLNITDQIDWIPWVNRTKLTQIYQSHDAFLFPSLRDSGGLVVLEAMAHGLPVICLDLGGPGEIINDSCGIKISVAGRTEPQIIKDLMASLLRCARDQALHRKLKHNAPTQADSFNWKAKIEKLYCKNQI